ncbi:MAG: hypothetical protein ACRC0L_08845 [Angustibacter sp.]
MFLERPGTDRALRQQIRLTILTGGLLLALVAYFANDLLRNFAALGKVLAQPEIQERCGWLLKGGGLPEKLPPTDLINDSALADLNWLRSKCEAVGRDMVVFQIQKEYVLNKTEMDQRISTQPGATFVAVGPSASAYAYGFSDLLSLQTARAVARVDDETVLSVVWSMPEVTQARIDALLQWSQVIADRLGRYQELDRPTPR